MYQVIIGVLVLIILVGGAFIIGGKRSPINAGLGAEATSSDQTAMDDGAMPADDSAMTATEKSTAKPGTPAPALSATAEGDSVSTSDQKAGSKVTVDTVTVTKPTWIAIRRSNDWTIGVQLVQPGTHQNVVVNLVRPTIAGDKYSVVLMADNGDGVFDLHKETLLMNADGSRVSVAFLAK